MAVLCVTRHNVTLEPLCPRRPGCLTRRLPPPGQRARRGPEGPSPRWRRQGRPPVPPRGCPASNRDAEAGGGEAPRRSHLQVTRFGSQSNLGAPDAAPPTPRCPSTAPQGSQAAKGPGSLDPTPPGSGGGTCAGRPIARTGWVPASTCRPTSHSQGAGANQELASQNPATLC